ncbi:hypothetical protein SALBM217S_03518 [Streptomyces griseoloalbus]
MYSQVPSPLMCTRSTLPAPACCAPPVSAARASPGAPTARIESVAVAAPDGRYATSARAWPNLSPASAPALSSGLSWSSPVTTVGRPAASSVWLNTDRLPAFASPPIASPGAPTAMKLASPATAVPKPSFASAAPGTLPESWLMSMLVLSCT